MTLEKLAKRAERQRLHRAGQWPRLSSPTVPDWRWFLHHSPHQRDPRVFLGCFAGDPLMHRLVKGHRCEHEAVAAHLCQPSPLPRERLGLRERVPGAPAARDRAYRPRWRGHDACLVARAAGDPLAWRAYHADVGAWRVRRLGYRAVHPTRHETAAAVVEHLRDVARLP
jgi:hypothetical protein